MPRAARAMVTVAEAREAARRLVDRDGRRWAASGDYGAVLEIALHPPTEAEALRDTAAAVAWVTSWRGADPLTEVEWQQRRWANLGTQRVPVRCTVRGADAIARVAGRSSGWAVLRDRAELLRERCPDDSEGRAALSVVIRREARVLAALDAADFDRLIGVLDWLSAHPDSGWYIRQLPIRGVDTKWVGRHRSLAESLHRAITGCAGLGIAEAPSLVRIRFLDQRLLPVGIGEQIADFSAPVSELARLDVRPRVVLVFENLESVIAMPELSGAIVVHGSGYAVDQLGRIPWIRDGRILYWGDLDSNGFAILNRIRSHGRDVTSVLMDEQTLMDHRDLWGAEPMPNRGAFPLLTEAEQEVVARLRADGDIRMEQERIAWEYALSALRAASSP